VTAKDQARSRIGAAAGQLLELSHRIHAHSEAAWAEHRAEPFAVDHQHISYRGATAHAAAYPELGVNAADAFTIAQVAIGLLRQQLPASVRVHGIVTHAGLAPNAIPGRAEGRWYVRAASLAELDRIEPRVRACFQAGALATGCELTIGVATFAEQLAGRRREPGSNCHAST
jgi:metal-dependent amidase/aminoacylase/carboxypeptidase family protein